MTVRDPFAKQVALLVRPSVPIINRYKDVFALKGGTAIFFTATCHACRLIST